MTAASPSFAQQVDVDVRPPPPPQDNSLRTVGIVSTTAGGVGLTATPVFLVGLVADGIRTCNALENGGGCSSTSGEIWSGLLLGAFITGIVGLAIGIPALVLSRHSHVAHGMALGPSGFALRF